MVFNLLETAVIPVVRKKIAITENITLPLHISGALEVSIATMKKADRLSTEEVYVIGFVPSYLLPHKRPIALDPFLELFIKEIEDGFIEGTTKSHG